MTREQAEELADAVDQVERHADDVMQRLERDEAPTVDELGSLRRAAEAVATLADEFEEEAGLS